MKKLFDIYKSQLETRIATVSPRLRCDGQHQCCQNSAHSVCPLNIHAVNISGVFGLRRVNFKVVLLKVNLSLIVVVCAFN